MKDFCLAFLALLSFTADGQNVRNFKDEAFDLRIFLAENHVEPRTINDQYSLDVFQLILDEIDPDKLYFTQQDIDWLAAYKTSIDDELMGGNWVFLNRLKERYQSSL